MPLSSDRLLDVEPLTWAQRLNHLKDAAYSLDGEAQFQALREIAALEMAHDKPMSHVQARKLTHKQLIELGFRAHDPISYRIGAQFAANPRYTYSHRDGGLSFMTRTQAREYAWKHGMHL